MKKLHLSLDSLKVVSFTTDVPAAARGTVHGASIFEPTGLTYCIQCGSNDTYDWGCPPETERLNTCDGRPGGPCGPQTE